jgi:hypothetical protein
MASMQLNIFYQGLQMRFLFFESGFLSATLGAVPSAAHAALETLI